MELEKNENKYNNCNSLIESNSERIKELEKAKQLIELEIKDLEHKNALLNAEKLMTGLEICRIKGHVTYWGQSFLDGNDVVCVCERCNGIAKIKL